MVRYLLLTCGFLLFGSALFAQTSLGGKVIEQESGDPVIYGSVAIYKNDVLITGVETDFDGVFSFNPLDPGTYDVEVSYVGFPSKRITGVLVIDNKANTLNVEMSEGIDLQEIVVVGYEVPLVEADNTVQGQTLTSAEIKRRPVRGVNALAASTAGVASSDEGGALTIRGSRSNATDYYLDGIRISGRSLPQQDIDQLQVITGGIPALYGDVTGGIISLTSKGPSSKFSGGVELETSQLFDNYNYNLGAINLSGPLIKKKTGESILGFRLSAQYLSQDDDDPPSLDRQLVKPDVLTSLQEKPLTQIVNPDGSITFVPSATFLTKDDWDNIDYNPYENRENLDLTAKLDLRVNKAIDLSFTGTYNDQSNQFTPTTDNSFLPGGSGRWEIFNNYTNPTSQDNRYRGNVRFRHRIGAGNSLEGEDTGDATKAALIQNASYTIQAAYEFHTDEVGDPRHGDNFFDYGYIGNFNAGYVPFIQPRFDATDSVFVVEQVDWSEEFFLNDETTPAFQAIGNNPILGTYANQILDANTNPDLSLQSIDVINGRVSGPLTNVFNFYTNVGTVYNRYNKGEDERITANVNGQFELVPESGGRHSIQFGFLYEQRRDRNYRLNPFELWTLADNLANTHLIGTALDSTNFLYNQDFEFMDSTYSVPIFASNPNNPTTTNFYKRVREVTGQPLYEYVNVHGLSPDQLSLDMFTASELLDRGYVSYYGYDYLGNKIDGVTFDDFFTATDPDNPDVRTFPVAAFEPNYASVFVQDKFKYKDIIFRLGLRVDRYDANTKVLKDPYSLYDVIGAADFHNQPNVPGERPGNIGDDFKVYTTDATSNDVEAYRDGDTWYFPDGTQANNGSEIYGSRLVFPRYTVENPDIQAVGFDTDISFEDYEPQINVMPRLAFSFPISDEANFFAHYDVLVQRPPSNSFVNPSRYYYWEQAGLRNNSNLRPEKTIDYEIGFQQKLSNSSAIKLAAYYKELRDMIQARFYFQVDQLGEYETFDNLDFGTVKGFSASYDLRRTGNVQLNVAYTLQFADGTGSDSESSRSTGTKNIVRVLSPLNFDERHRLVINLDYRYGSGKQYNGPKIGGVDIFSNTGLNLQYSTVSGRPYTAERDVTAEFTGSGTVGSINGSRLPWTQTLNLRIDKSFALTKPGAARPLNMNVFFRVSNLLDARNIINVYTATGSPTDDGWLVSPLGQNRAETFGTRAQSYLDSYQTRVLNPDFYSLPRRMYVGLTFDF